MELSEAHKVWSIGWLSKGKKKYAIRLALAPNPEAGGRVMWRASLKEAGRRRPTREAREAPRRGPDEVL